MNDHVGPLACGGFNESLVIAFGHGKSVVVVDPQAVEMGKRAFHIESDSFDSQVRCIALERTGRLLVATDERKVLRIWERVGIVWKLRFSTILCLSFFPSIETTSTLSNPILLIGDASGDIYASSCPEPFVDEIQIELVASLTSPVSDCALWVDGGRSLLISADLHERICTMRYPQTYSAVSFCLGHSSYVARARPVLCGEDLCVLSVAGDGLLVLWDQESGEMCASFNLADVVSQSVNSFQETVDGLKVHVAVLQLSLWKSSDGTSFASVLFGDGRKPELLLFRVTRTKQLSLFHTLQFPSRESSYQVTDCCVDASGRLWALAVQNGVCSLWTHALGNLEESVPERFSWNGKLTDLKVRLRLPMEMCSHVLLGELSKTGKDPTSGWSLSAKRRERQERKEASSVLSADHPLEESTGRLLCEKSKKGLFVLFGDAYDPDDGPVMVYQFTRTNFTFEDRERTREYWDKEHYKNIVITGVRQSDDDVFVTIPRWKNAHEIPATLCRVKDNDLLEPFPNWEWNNLTAPLSLRSVLGMEIDSTNTMWVLDQGRVNGNEAPPAYVEKPWKLVKITVWNGVVENVYELDEYLAPRRTAFLNDLVVDRLNQWVYISDSGIPMNSSEPNEAGLIIWNMNAAAGKRVLSGHSSTVPNKNVKFSINGNPVLSSSPMETGVDGIALAPDGKYLLYCPLTGLSVYQIPTAVLWDWASPNYELRVQESISFYLNKSFTSDGIAFGSNFHLYLTMLGPNITAVPTPPPPGPPPEFPFRIPTQVATNGILEYHLESGEFLESKILVQDDAVMMWPDGIGFDNKGSIIFTTNQLHNFLDNKLDFTEGVITYRIWRMWVNTNSYTTVLEPAFGNKRGPRIWELVIGLLSMVASILVLFCVFCGIYSYKQIKWRVRHTPTKYGDG